MICQEIVEILDNQKVGLDSARRRQAQAHVAGCADCARAWHAQTSLASLPDMAMPADFLAHCRAAVVARTVPAASQRASRKLLWGSLTALAAAAATVVLLSRPNQPTAPEQMVRVVQTEAAPVVNVAPAATPSEKAPALAIKTVAAPLFTVRVALPDPPPAEQAAASAAVNDPAAQAVLQSMYSALIAELRKVPDLAVVDKDPAEITSASRHYRLRIAPTSMTGLDGRIMRWEHGYPVDLTALELQPGGTSTERLYTGVLVGIDSIATCTGVAPAKDIPCPNVPEAAAELVHTLRQAVFPPDSSVTRPLQARFRDSSLAPEERFKSFTELFMQQARTGGKRLLRDPGVVHAAIELASYVDAAHRAQVWRGMRGVGDALLVEPLLASLQQDPEVVRIAAIETLAADFSGDQRVRSALETAAISDPRPLVRAVAQRGLTGEEGWRTYVTSSLKNSSLPDSQRVEALLYELYPADPREERSNASRANYWQILKGLDDVAVSALVEIFPRADVFRRGQSNNLLGNFAGAHNQNPAVTDMLLTVLEHDTRALNRAVAGQHLAEMHSSEPRVREALLKAVSNDPDASVRDDLRQILERDYVKKAMGAAAQ